MRIERIFGDLKKENIPMLSGIIPKKIHLDFPQKLKCVNIKCLSLGKYCVLYLVRRGIRPSCRNERLRPYLSERNLEACVPIHYVELDHSWRGIGSCKNRTSPQVEVELLAFFFAPSIPALRTLG